MNNLEFECCQQEPTVAEICKGNINRLRRQSQLKRMRMPNVWDCINSYKIVGISYCATGMEDVISEYYSARNGTSIILRFIQAEFQKWTIDFMLTYTPELKNDKMF